VTTTQTTLGLYLDIWDQIINKGRLDLIDQYFAADYVFETPTVSLRGPAAARQYYSALLGAFSDAEFVVEDAFESDGKLAKRWVFRGTHTGALDGIPPTGKRVTLAGVTLARMANGKIVEERDYADTLGLLQQLGVIPAPGV
jgi:steroid delta-isomerase-like uncharacterized protein